jgi:two-component system, NarL family, nitrate/nitrite response regulator NarL
VPARSRCALGQPESYDLHKDASNSENPGLSNRTVRVRRSSNMRKEERLVTIAHGAGAAFRVVIVDRDSMSSNLLANALVRECGCQAVAIHADELLYSLPSSDFDLVVIGTEVNSKSGDAFELTETVSQTYPDANVIVLLNQTSPESVIQAFRAGARGVFSRQQPMAEFLDCVEHVRKGFIWAGKEQTDSLLRALKSIPAPNPFTAGDSPSLTARELEVVQYAAKGKTNKIIASELGLSEHTVKNYLFRAFEKLGVSSRVELLFYLTLKGHTFSASRVESVNEDPVVE